MNRSLRVLYLEDDVDFTALVKTMLQRDGFCPELTPVSDFPAFTNALNAAVYDVILADYSLPTCNGIQALELARQNHPETPFLLVSGTIGEQAAIDSLKCGATDYILKTGLERLVPAVRRAVQQAGERAQLRHAETELIRREKYFRTLTENSQDILGILNRDGVFQYNSPSLRTVLGYDPRELIGRAIFEFINPADLGGFREVFEQTVASPDWRFKKDFRFRHKDESWRCLEAVGQNRLDDPDIAGVVVNSRDVSERKHAEAEVRESEKQYRLIFDGNPVPMWVSDLETCAFLEVNEAAVQHYGYPREEFLSRTTKDIRPPEDVQRLAHYLTEVVNKTPLKTGIGHAGMWRHRKKDGTIIEVEITWSIVAFKGRRALLTMANDVTERLRGERALRESEQRFRELFENSPDAIVVTDLNGEILDVNPAECALHRTTRDCLIGRNITACAPPDHHQEVISELAKLATGDVNQIECVCLTQDGREIPIEVRGNCIEYGGKQALLLHVRDTTERKQAAEALRNSEASLAAAQRISHLGSWELDLANPEDLNRSELRWSDETYRIFGLEPRELPVTYEKFLGFVHSDDRRRVADAVQQAVRTQGTYDTEHRIIARNGEERILRGRAELVCDSNSTPVKLRGIVMDITDRKRLEEQLRQSQKMEAIGQLAGGVAHDFNNILTVIHGHASLLLEDEMLPPSAGRSAQEITQAAERAAGLTRQLLTFSRRQVMQPRRLDMNELVSNMTMMLGRILGEDITLQLNYSPYPAFVQADASMIEQVLLNLAVNARDAMPQGGQLSIRIALTTVTSRRLLYHPEARHGEFVCLTVIDTGSGIAPENLRHIFEPFFTTKEVGKGTGLGLATVYGIVKQHQGWIDVDSEPGHGATFRVYLPVSSSVATPAEAEGKRLPVRGGNETILVVEDEAPVRQLVCNILERYGYKILQASSGAKALEVCQETRQKVDLLLTDLVMPDRINGRDLAEQLRHQQPSLKVIFTSGYSADVVGKDFVLQQGLRYLQKPYEPQKLASAVRECLDS